MTEQAVKDAKAKRDAAQADLDKAVADTQDEIQKATDAVKDAAPEKASEPAKPAGPPTIHPDAIPEPIHPAYASLSQPSSSSNWPKIAIAVAVLLGVLAVVHWGFKLF